MGGLDRIESRLATEGLALDEPGAEDLLRTDPNALLIGVLLDQQIRAETAFTGPYRLKQRLGHLDMQRIAEMDADAFARVFAEKPAVHRFASMMAARTQALARYVADELAGDASTLWKDDPEDQTLAARARKLPGFGPGKVQTLQHALRLFGHRR